jgi:hypothetical protein
MAIRFSSGVVRTPGCSAQPGHQAVWLSRQGDEAMKTRRTFVLLALVLLAALLLAAPVQAGRKVTEFLAASVSWDYTLIGESTTGGVLHQQIRGVETMRATDPRFEGTLTTDFVCIGLPGHPQSDPTGASWGTCNYTWRLEATGSSGWQGVAHGYPQTDFRVLMMKATGQGYGEFSGMKIEWTISADFYQDPYYIRGSITGSE